MRVLVLGADGFVGRRTVDALAASGWATPFAGVRRERSGDSVERVLLDAGDPASLALAIGPMDAVVNCVAADEATIVANARALAAVAGGRRVVHLSSMAVYGSATGMVDEDTPLFADDSGYAVAKMRAEHALAGLDDRVILRPGCIYGPGSARWSLRMARLLIARRIGDLGPAGDGCSNIVHVDDVAAAILASLREPAAQGLAFNLAMPDAPDWNGYFLAFARALGAVPVRRIPGWEMGLERRLLAVPLEIGNRLSQRVPPSVSPALARQWRQDIRLSSARASSMLGIAWRPLAEALVETAAWCTATLSRPRSES